MTDNGLGWSGIFRLGLVQTAMGAIIVLTTSTLNRVMVVELVLPAMLPGFLVAIHHVVQLARPKIGHGSDLAGRRTPWIRGGMLVLGLGGVAAALGTVVMPSSLLYGSVVAFLGFVAIGLGSGATGTSLLVLLAKEVRTDRKPAAATLVWFMMIAGFAITAGLAGHFLDPYSPERLLLVTTTVACIAVTMAWLALIGLERTAQTPPQVDPSNPRQNFRKAFLDVWREPSARKFTVFVFLSMLAYSFQDLILEPFAGLVFDMTPGESTQLAGTQHAGVLLGMIAVAASGSLLRGSSAIMLRRWIVGGCIASGFALAGIAWGGTNPGAWNLSANVFFMGFTNGAFAVAAIASMMVLASQGESGKEGLRMGLWGAAQAIAFAIGGFLGTVVVDVSRQWFFSEPAQAYAFTFLLEACLFFVAARLAMSIDKLSPATTQAPGFGDVAMQEVMAARN